MVGRRPLVQQTGEVDEMMQDDGDGDGRADPYQHRLAEDPRFPGAAAKRQIDGAELRQQGQDVVVVHAEIELERDDLADILRRMEPGRRGKDHEVGQLAEEYVKAAV